MGMTRFHEDYKEYATCVKCGLKKYCKLEGKVMICYACNHGNFAKMNWKKK